jgi:Carboxypeptidase regulatory-like domain
LPRARKWLVPICAAAGVVAYVGWLQWSRALEASRPAELDPAESAIPAAHEGEQTVVSAEAWDERTPATAAAAPPKLDGEADVAAHAAVTARAGPGAEAAVPTASSPASTVPAPGTSHPEPRPTPPRKAARNEEDAPAAEPDEAKDKARPPLSLGGSVLDRDGSAAAGVPVHARPRRLFAALDDGGGMAPVPEQRAVTDGAGRFGFAEVPDGEYELQTEPTETYEKALAVVRAGTDSAVLVVEKKSGRSLLVHGVVESSRGGPLKGVRIEVVGQPRLAATSDESGGYGLRMPLSARVTDPSLRFLRDGFREQRVAIGAEEAANADDVVRDVRLDPSSLLATVAGTVTAAGGPPVARASVQLYSAKVGRRYQAVTDGNGRFTLTDVEESDDYRLWVHADGGYRDHVREPVEVHGPASLDVSLESLRASSLRGSMVDPEGRPLAGFTLWLRSAFGGATSLAVTGDEQGRFAVSDLSEGPVALETRAAPQLSITGISLTAGSPRDVVLVLDVGAYVLEGYLLTDRGGPVGGARVSLQWWRPDGGLNSRSFRETVSDARGYFAFTQLGAGAHTLSVTADGFRGVRREAQVGPGAPPLEIRLPASP